MVVRDMPKPIAPACYRNLIVLADAFAKATGLKLKTISRKAHSDPRFFDSLKAGEISLTIRKYDELIEWFDKNWPDGVKHPAIKEMR